MSKLNPLIFRAYDIRGTYSKDIDKDKAYLIGRSFGSYIQRFNQKNAVVGYDNRVSSPILNEAIIRGITSTGVNVISLGLVTTPMYYFARNYLNIYSGIMITASHNPGDDNGFKISFTKDGNALGDEIKDFYNFIIQGKFLDGNGTSKGFSIKNYYIELFKNNLNFFKKIKVVVDVGNGTGSIIVKELLDNLFIDYDLLFATSDPTFPNHHPDPSIPSNLKALQKRVVELNYDLGIGIDADGDRVGIVDNLGNIISNDNYMIIIYNYLKDKIKNKTALYDVKCSKALSEYLTRLNYNQKMIRTGNSYLYRYVHENKIDFGGEYSGHLIFNDRFSGFDDGLYAGLRLVEILSKTDKTLNELIKDLKIDNYYSTEEIKISVSDSVKFKVMNEIEHYFITNKYNFIKIDGIRVEDMDYWFLIRVSNTTPNLTLRFEAKTKELLNEIKAKYIEITKDIIAKEKSD